MALRIKEIGIRMKVRYVVMLLHEDMFAPSVPTALFTKDIGIHMNCTLTGTAFKDLCTLPGITLILNGILVKEASLRELRNFALACSGAL